MTFISRKYISRVLAIVMAFTLITPFITPVYATDSVDSLEQSTSELEDELSGLKGDLEKLGDEIASISKQIADMTKRIQDTKEELATLKGEEEAQYEAMKTRIQYMYENGNEGLLEILFASNSMADFLNRAEYFATIQEYDRAALKKLAATQESIMEREAQLEQEQEDLIALMDSLNNKEKALTSQIDAASSELNTQKRALEKARKDAKDAEEALKKPVVPIVPEKPVLPSVSDDSEDDFDYTASASDLELFAALIECEAGSTNYEGMLAVASVVVNRMKDSRYPDTLRGVIFQSGQFPPATNGKVDRVLARGVKDSCMQAAADALAGKNNVGDCLSFRAASSGHVGTIIGDNVFF